MPMSMIMQKRHPEHYMDVGMRCSSVALSLSPGSEVICLNPKLYGILGRVQKVKAKENQVIVEFDRKEEESKIHDPFMG